MNDGRKELYGHLSLALFFCLWGAVFALHNTISYGNQVHIQRVILPVRIGLSAFFFVLAVKSFYKIANMPAKVKAYVLSDVRWWAINEAWRFAIAGLFGFWVLTIFQSMQHSGQLYDWMTGTRRVGFALFCALVILGCSYILLPAKLGAPWKTDKEN